MRFSHSLTSLRLFFATKYLQCLQGRTDSEEDLGADVYYFINKLELMMPSEFVGRTEYQFVIVRQRECVSLSRHLAYVRSIDRGSGTLLISCVTVYQRLSMHGLYPFIHSYIAKPSSK